MEKVLIAYATTSGSTQEIAEFIAHRLATLGIENEIHPCREVSNLETYRAIVIGAPLYMFHLHKDAVSFLKRNQKMLDSIPVAVFAGGPFGENSEKELEDVRKNLENELAKFSWLHPVSVHVVGGKFDPTGLRFPYNLIRALKQLPPSDTRDWQDIDEWVSGLPMQSSSS
jgi:menaquinone-dependent protoporphyrinogen oxidase